jgi:mannosyltransferase OCH1-like enzyme
MTIHLLAPKDQTKWPNIWHKCYKSWRECPYKIKIWDDEDIDNLLKEDDKEFFNILDTLPPIYKFDYVRYIILEKFGGAYFDMDIEIIDPSFFQKLKPENLYIGSTYGSIGVENSIMIAENGYRRYFWDVLKIFTKTQIYNSNQINNIENTPYKTGPVALSNFLLKMFKSKGPLDNSIQILPWEMFGQRNQDLSYTIHHYSNSWHN